jgi:hypothetical protein
MNQPMKDPFHLYSTQKVSHLTQFQQSAVSVSTVHRKVLWGLDFFLLECMGLVFDVFAVKISFITAYALLGSQKIVSQQLSVKGASQPQIFKEKNVQSLSRLQPDRLSW